MSLIIVISGKKQSGKNTCANYIIGRYLVLKGIISDFKLDSFGRLKCASRMNIWTTIREDLINDFLYKTDAKIYSFADSLKEFCMNVLGLTHEQCYGSDEYKNSLTNLEWLQMPFLPRYKICGKYKMTAREILQYFGTDIIRKMCPDAWVNATVNKIKNENKELAILTDGRFPNEINGIHSIGGYSIRLLRVKNEDAHESEMALDQYLLENYSFVVDNSHDTIEQQNEKISNIVDDLFEQLKNERTK